MTSSSLLRALATMTLVTGCSDAGFVKHNAPPEAAILSHVDGDEVLEAYEVRFLGNVSDPDNAADTLRVIWYSGETILCEETAAEADGSTSCAYVMTMDDTAIHLEVYDPEGASAAAKVNLVVTPTESPEAFITSPEFSGVY